MCLAYARGLKFQERPDYDYLRTLLFSISNSSSLLQLKDLCFNMERHRKRQKTATSLIGKRPKAHRGSFFRSISDKMHNILAVPLVIRNSFADYNNQVQHTHSVEEPQCTERGHLPEFKDRKHIRRATHSVSNHCVIQ